MHRQRLGVQLDSGDLRVQFPGAIVLIVIGVLCGIGVGVFQGSRSGDEVGGVVNAWQYAGLGAGAGVAVWLALTGSFRSASLKEWGRVKEMVGSACRLRGGGACVRARVVGVAGVKAGRRPPPRGLALTPASDDAESSSGPDGQHGAGVRLGLGCGTVVLTI
jgi:hypothetical protein